MEIDVEGMSVTAGGGCQAVDLETPLQGMTSPSTETCCEEEGSIAE